MSNNFYPRISDLLSIQSIPVYLQSILNIENGVLSNIFYRNLQFLNSADNSSSSHRIELILPNSIDLPIFNSGIDLVLNADPLDPMNSTFILELEYTLPIKKYISTFQSIKSTLAANDILDLFSKAFNIDEINLLTNYIREFELNSDNDPIVTFIDDINTKFNLEPSIKYPDVDLSIEEQIKNVHSDLRSINFNLVEYLLSECKLPIFRTDQK
jgi:hypothetical protein